MAIQKTDKIWHNGKFIDWDDATIHVMSHVVHYGSSVFEGIRCYALPSGPAIFRATEHIQRLIDSARIYRIDVLFTRDEILRAMVELVSHNGVWPWPWRAECWERCGSTKKCRRQLPRWHRRPNISPRGSCKYKFLWES